MTFQIKNIIPFTHRLYGECVDVQVIRIISCKENSLGLDKWRNIVHFIYPADELYLAPIRFAYNLKASWAPRWSDYTIDFITDLSLIFPNLDRDLNANGFIHKGFFIDTNAPFKFEILTALKFVDEIYSHVTIKRDVFNYPYRDATVICLIKAIQYGTECTHLNSSSESTRKIVKFLFPLKEELLKPIFETKAKKVLWEPNPDMFSFDKCTELISEGPKESIIESLALVYSPNSLEYKWF